MWQGAADVHELHLSHLQAQGLRLPARGHGSPAGTGLGQWQECVSHVQGQARGCGHITSSATLQTCTAH